jgi:hypothetical protein
MTAGSSQVLLPWVSDLHTRPSPHVTPPIGIGQGSPRVGGVTQRAVTIWHTSPDWQPPTAKLLQSAPMAALGAQKVPMRFPGMQMRFRGHWKEVSQGVVVG